MYDAKTLLAVECGAASIFLKQSAIYYKEAGIDVFAGCQIEPGEVICY